MRARNKTNECIDYIKFKYDDKSTDEICGDIKPEYQNLISLDVRESEVKTSIHIDTRYPLKTNEKLEFKVSYTSYFSEYIIIFFY